jgi:hypothetical protein
VRQGHRARHQDAIRSRSGTGIPRFGHGVGTRQGWAPVGRLSSPVAQGAGPTQTPATLLGSLAGGAEHPGNLGPGVSPVRPATASPQLGRWEASSSERRPREQRGSRYRRLRPGVPRSSEDTDGRHRRIGLRTVCGFLRGRASLPRNRSGPLGS